MTTPKPTDINTLFNDLAQNLAQFKVPGVDMNQIVESRRKDIDALVAANQAMLDSMQALARKQTELLSQALQGVQEAASGLAPGADGKPVVMDPAQLAELTQKACAKAVNDARDLAEMARKAQIDAMTGIGQRATQSLQEMQAMTRPTK
jgi:phasin family protein